MTNRSNTFYLHDKDLWIKHFHEEGYCIIRDLYNQNNIDEAILYAYLNDIKGMLERQLSKEQLRRTK